MYAPNAEQRARDDRLIETRRSMIQFFGSACGILVAGPAMWIVLLHFLNAETGSTLIGIAGWAVAAVAGLLAAGGLAYSLARGLGLAFAVRIARGPQYVGWSWPSNCASYVTWFFREWRFYGRSGLQFGERNFGIEVAIDGELS